MTGQQNSYSLKDRIRKKIEDRKKHIEDGKINSIPLPFPRFSKEFIGTEQRKMIVVTSFTKGSKTQFVSNVFIFNNIFYAYYNPDKIRIRFFMYLLEETKEDMVLRFMSHLIYKLSDYTMEISPEQLLSSNNVPISKEVLDIMDSEEFNKIMDFFEAHVFFSDSSNPTGVYTECLSYAKEHGKIHTVRKKYKDELGDIKEVDAFDWYEQDDPEEYRILIVDHVSLLSQERGFTLKQSIDKLGEYCILLRDRYNFTSILIQQQNTDQESLDAYKMQRLRPSVAGLADSKYTARNCNILIGLFSPMRFELPSYKGYNIEILKDNVRFCEIILNRGGNMGGMVALYFNGKVCDFKELPIPSETRQLDKWYDWIKNKRKTNKSFFMYMKKLFIN